MRQFTVETGSSRHTHNMGTERNKTLVRCVMFQEISTLGHARETSTVRYTQDTSAVHHTLNENFASCSRN